MTKYTSFVWLCLLLVLVSCQTAERPASTRQTISEKDADISLAELVRRSDTIVVGSLKTSDDSQANKMWAGHITVHKVLLGDPTTTDIHVHFYHPEVARGAALREDGQNGVWFIFRNGNLLSISMPYQLKPESYEATLVPRLKEFLKSEIQRLSHPDAQVSEVRLRHLKLNYSAIKK